MRSPRHTAVSRRAASAGSSFCVRTSRRDARPGDNKESTPTPQTRHAFRPSAVSAAKDGAVMFDTMPNDAAAAMGTGRRERLDGTFERVEDHGAAGHRNLEAFVIVVAALLASRHRTPPNTHRESQT